MIEFNEFGNPVAKKSPVLMTQEEYKSIFLDDTTTRKSIWNGYLRYQEALKKYLSKPFYQYLNGSFSTKKKTPNDIDVVSFIPFSRETLSVEVLFDMNKSLGRPKMIYKVDGYVVLTFAEGHKFYSDTEKRLQYWQKQFGNDRQMRNKALLEVRYD